MSKSTIQDVMTTSQIATAAQRQYFSRPADQRFSTLDELFAKVDTRRRTASEFNADVVDVKAHRDPDGGIIFQADIEMSQFDLENTKKLPQIMTPTHWAFGQVAARIGAPAADMRKIAAEGAEDLVVQRINHGLRHTKSEAIKFLAVDGDSDAMTMYAATSPTYGRIWDADVVAAAKQVIDAQEGRFYSPWAWGHKHRALFGSSQDVFMYFIDGGSIVDGGGDRDQLHRGVYIWNSEVGAATFGIATFLFRGTCGNFLVWGIENARILNIRHTSGGPEKFVTDAIPALKEFAESSVKQLEAGVIAAKKYELSTDPDEVIKFAVDHGFTRAEAKRAIAAANTEEGQCATLWDLVNGFTATARMMAFADAKVDLEVRAGKLMKIAEKSA